MTRPYPSVEDLAELQGAAACACCDTYVECPRPTFLIEWYEYSYNSTHGGYENGATYPFPSYPVFTHGYSCYSTFKGLTGSNATDCFYAEREKVKSGCGFAVNVTNSTEPKPCTTGYTYSGSRSLADIDGSEAFVDTDPCVTETGPFESNQTTSTSESHGISYSHSDPNSVSFSKTYKVVKWRIKLVYPTMAGGTPTTTSQAYTCKVAQRHLDEAGTWLTTADITTETLTFPIGTLPDDTVEGTWHWLMPGTSSVDSTSDGTQSSWTRTFYKEDVVALNGVFDVDFPDEHPGYNGPCVDILPSFCYDEFFNPVDCTDPTVFYCYDEFFTPMDCP